MDRISAVCALWVVCFCILVRATADAPAAGQKVPATQAAVPATQPADEAENLKIKQVLADADNDYAKLDKIEEEYHPLHDRSWRGGSFSLWFLIENGAYPKNCQLYKNSDAPEKYAEEMKEKYGTFANKNGEIAEKSKVVLSAAEKALKMISHFRNIFEAALAESAEAVPKAMAELKGTAQYAVSQNELDTMCQYIPHKLDNINNGIRQLEQAGVRPKETAELRKKFDALAADIEKQRKSMEDKIIAQVRLPADVYKGEDRKKIEQAVRDAWGKEYPGKTVMLVRFHVAESKNEEGFKADSTGKKFVKFKTDTLPVKVVVKNPDGKTANVYSAFCIRDYRNRTTYVNVKTRNKDYPFETMLVENINK